MNKSDGIKSVLKAMAEILPSKEDLQDFYDGPEPKKQAEQSTINHPSHYNQFRFEAISVIEDWKLNFNTGNALKYVARYKFKGKEIEDLEKAVFYLSREIATLKAAKK